MIKGLLFFAIFLVCLANQWALASDRDFKFISVCAFSLDDIEENGLVGDLELEFELSENLLVKPCELLWTLLGKTFAGQWRRKNLAPALKSLDIDVVLRLKLDKDKSGLKRVSIGVYDKDGECRVSRVLNFGADKSQTLVDIGNELSREILFLDSDTVVEDPFLLIQHETDALLLKRDEKIRDASVKNVGTPDVSKETINGDWDLVIVKKKSAKAPFEAKNFVWVNAIEKRLKPSLTFPHKRSN